MEPKNSPEIECCSLLVCAYVHLFLRKDPNGSGRHKHFRTSGLKREEKQGRQKYFVQRYPAFADWTSCTWLHRPLKFTRGDWGVSKDWNFISRLAISLLAVPTFQTKSCTEPTYTKVGQSKDALGEVGLIPNHCPLSSPTLVSPEGQGPPSNTAGKSYAQHSWVCELTVYLNLYPIHSVQNCSSAPPLWTKSPLATVQVSSQTHLHENYWFCLLTMQSSRHRPGLLTKNHWARPTSTSSTHTVHAPLSLGSTSGLLPGLPPKCSQFGLSLPENQRQSQRRWKTHAWLSVAPRGIAAECSLRWQSSFSCLHTQWQVFFGLLVVCILIQCIMPCRFRVEPGQQRGLGFTQGEVSHLQPWAGTGWGSGQGGAEPRGGTVQWDGRAPGLLHLSTVKKTWWT